MSIFSSNHHHQTLSDLRYDLDDMVGWVEGMAVYHIRSMMDGETLLWGWERMKGDDG